MGLTQFMKASLFETTPYDPAVCLLVTGILLLAAIVVCWSPARRAATVGPLVSCAASNGVLQLIHELRH